MKTVVISFCLIPKAPYPVETATPLTGVLLKEYPSQKPFFLSGGIGLENTQEIKELLNTDLPLHAIDVNSKFELAPGLKKIEDITQFKNELYEL